MLCMIRHDYVCVCEVIQYAGVAFIRDAYPYSLQGMGSLFYLLHRHQRFMKKYHDISSPRSPGPVSCAAAAAALECPDHPF